MTSIDAIGGTALGGTLYGIGVGPGDISYLTLRAAALVRDVDVIAFFAKRGLQGNARGIVDPLIKPHRHELRLEYPVTNEIPPEDPSYQEQISRFYEEGVETLSALLRQGKSVGLLAEGDPFFYGSFMHMWRRLEAIFPLEVVPGVTGMSGCWTRANAPITWGNDILSVLPGTLGEEQLIRRLTETDAAVIMKVGKNLAKVRRAVEAAGFLSPPPHVGGGPPPGQHDMPFSGSPHPTSPLL